MQGGETQGREKYANVFYDVKYACSMTFMTFLADVQIVANFLFRVGSSFSGFNAFVHVHCTLMCIAVPVRMFVGLFDVRSLAI